MVAARDQKRGEGWRWGCRRGAEWGGQVCTLTTNLQLNMTKELRRWALAGGGGGEGQTAVNSLCGCCDDDNKNLRPEEEKTTECCPFFRERFGVEKPDGCVTSLHMDNVGVIDLSPAARSVPGIDKKECDKGRCTCPATGCAAAKAKRTSTPQGLEP